MSITFPSVITRRSWSLLVRRSFSESGSVGGCSSTARTVSHPFRQRLFLFAETSGRQVRGECEKGRGGRGKAPITARTKFPVKTLDGRLFDETPPEAPQCRYVLTIPPLFASFASGKIRGEPSVDDESCGRSRSTQETRRKIMKIYINAKDRPCRSRADATDCGRARSTAEEGSRAYIRRLT